MFRMIGLSIEISKEDTATFDLSFQGEGLYFDSETKVIIALKRRPRDDVIIWSKELKLEAKEGKYYLTVPLDSKDTNYTGGTYWWDVRMVAPDGEVYTPFAPQRFSILEVVGDV